MSSGSSEKEKNKEDKKETNDLASLFEIYSKFGDSQSDGSTITLKNVDKWLKQAGILGDKKTGINNADTAITFSKIAKNMKRIDLAQFQEFMDTIAADKNLEASELTGQLVASGEPKMTNVTKVVKGGVVGENLRRMTDVSLYTGAHKQRFSESGQGKGIEGREDRQSMTGYVAGYKGQDSYSKKKTDEKDQKQTKTDLGEKQKKTDEDEKQKKKSPDKK